MTDALALVQGALVGSLDGLTGLLPVAGGGHLAVAGAFIGLAGERLQAFEAAIAPALALAVAATCRRWTAWAALRAVGAAARRRVALGGVLALLPTVVAGVVAPAALQGWFVNGATAVGLAFLGGALILRLDHDGGRDWPAVGLRDALALGLLECLGLALPGLGGPCATVIGGLALGLSRRVAVEAGLLLTAPCVAVAGAAGLARLGGLLHADDIPALALAAACAFAYACLTARWLAASLAAHGLAPLGWYRFTYGFVASATLVAGIVKWAP
jgi:undecaprenyl-diphosphatase